MSVRRTSNAICIGTLTSIVLLGGCAGTPTEQTGRVMTGDQIREMLTYNSEETANESGGIWRSFHPDDETEVGQYTEPNGTIMDITARKTYKENAVCVEWSKQEWGTQCYENRQDGETISYRNVNDSKDRGIITVLEGNPFEF